MKLWQICQTLTLVALFAVSGLFAPTSDTKGHEEKQSVKAGDNLPGDSLPVRCVNPSGSSFVPCGVDPGTPQPVSQAVVGAVMADDGSCPSGSSSFTIVAANASRKKLYLLASPSNTDYVFVKFGSSASSADFRLAPGQAINELGSFVYTGQVDAFPASGTQAVCVLEFN